HVRGVTPGVVEGGDPARALRRREADRERPVATDTCPGDGTGVQGELRRKPGVRVQVVNPEAEGGVRANGAPRPQPAVRPGRLQVHRGDDRPADVYREPEDRGHRCSPAGVILPARDDRRQGGVRVLVHVSLIHRVEVERRITEEGQVSPDHGVARLLQPVAGELLVRVDHRTRTTLRFISEVMMRSVSISGRSWDSSASAIRSRSASYISWTSSMSWTPSIRATLHVRQMSVWCRPRCRSPPGVTSSTSNLTVSWTLDRSRVVNVSMMIVRFVVSASSCRRGGMRGSGPMLDSVVPQRLHTVSESSL